MQDAEFLALLDFWVGATLLSGSPRITGKVGRKCVSLTLGLISARQELKNAFDGCKMGAFCQQQSGG